MTDIISYTPGFIVSCRDQSASFAGDRQWVVLPSEVEEIIRLRPLSGNEDEIAGISRQLGVEQIEAASYQSPDPKQVQDHTAALLLMNDFGVCDRDRVCPFSAPVFPKGRAYRRQLRLLSKCRISDIFNTFHKNS